MRPDRKPEVGKLKRILLGVVDVDSAMMMICDPMKIDRDWVRDTWPRIMYPTYADIDTGDFWQMQTPGDDKAPGAKAFPGNYGTPIPEYQGRCPNDLIASGQWVESALPEDESSGEFSYAGCGAASIRRPGSAQLNFSNGEPGAGVVFTSGFGDGLYEVWATIEDIPGWGRRVVQIDITLVHPYIYESRWKALKRGWNAFRRNKELKAIFGIGKESPKKGKV